MNGMWLCGDSTMRGPHMQHQYWHCITTWSYMATALRIIIICSGGQALHVVVQGGRRLAGNGVATSDVPLHTAM